MEYAVLDTFSHRYFLSILSEWIFFRNVDEGTLENTKERSLSLRKSGIVARENISPWNRLVSVLPIDARIYESLEQSQSLHPPLIQED